MAGAPPVQPMVYVSLAARLAAEPGFLSTMRGEDAAPTLDPSSLSTMLLFMIHEEDVELMTEDGCANVWVPRNSEARLLAVLVEQPSKDSGDGELTRLTNEELSMCTLRKSEITLHAGDFEMTFYPPNLSWFSVYDLLDAIGHFETMRAQSSSGEVDMRHALFEGVHAIDGPPGHYEICWGS